MGKTTGFMEYERIEEGYAPLRNVSSTTKEFVIGLTTDQAKVQAARCMDCGTPFCNNGCPVNNIIPDFNDLVYQGDWKNAITTLHSTNNFPEFTGRICPRPAKLPVWPISMAMPSASSPSSTPSSTVPGAKAGSSPCRPSTRQARRWPWSVPALQAWQRPSSLVRAGHDVTLFEKNDRVGGLLRYGIPDFKLDKGLIDRRVEQMVAEGLKIRTGVLIAGKDGLGKDSKVTNWAKETISPEQLNAEFDAVLLTGGSEQSRDLPVPGRDLEGVHFAMEFLPQQNKVNAGDKLKGQIRADGKHVIVIGGGDTGSDCVGTSTAMAPRA